MTESNYWVENYVSYLSSRNVGVHQASKDFEIEVSESVDFNPSIDVYVARGDKMSIQVPKSTKYHKVKRIQEADSLQYFNQTLYRLDHLDTSGGEYINTDDYAKYYELEAFIEGSHINITLRINHGVDMFDCKMGVSHSFTYRPGIPGNMYSFLKPHSVRSSTLCWSIATNGTHTCSFKTLSSLRRKLLSATASPSAVWSSTRTNTSTKPKPKC